MKRKICYVVTIPGTIESFFIPQLRYLAENDFDVTVICSSSDLLQQELGETVRFIPIDIPRGISFSGMLKAMNRLIKHFKAENYDMVQYSTPNAGFCASVASRLAGIKIRNYHLMGFRYLGANGIGRFILRTIEKVSCSLSTSIECVSQSNLELGIKEGIFPRDKAVVVWNGSTGGVDLRKFDYNKRAQWRYEVRSELGYSDTDFVYGFVGRITRDKGIHELLEAYFEIAGDSKLFLIGTMEGEESLDKELLDKAQKSKNVQFHKSAMDIERYYAAIDVLLLPSYREGFGNVVIEAAAVGTAAIVSDIPGPIDAIDRNKTAFVVPVQNAAALAETMRKIRHSDYVQMGQNAAAFAKDNFDSERLNEHILTRKQKMLNMSNDP